MALQKDDANERWAAAVERFGEPEVERGNEFMLEVEAYRERFDELMADGRVDEAANAMSTYRTALHRAAEEAVVEGNAYLRSIAEDRRDLQRAMDQVREERRVPAGEPVIQIGHTLEQQMRYAMPGRRAISADEAELEALRKQFSRTDFNYGYSDDPDARERGREEVRLASAAFTEFATRSSAHASAASAEWDKATDLIFPPTGYVPKSQRAELAAPVPGSPEAPIQIGHTIEQQLKYAGGQSAARERRVMLDKKPDPLELFRELYEDVTRTGADVPIGSLHKHAEGRLQQSFAALLLIEQAKQAGLIPDHANFVATGAKVQDKSTSRTYPAAHRLPADLSIEASDGTRRRLTDFFEEGLDRTWIDKHIFAPTDRIHRLANVADQWAEDGGMKKALVEAANEISHGKMSANTAMEKIIQPGYAAAIEKAREKIERNFSFMERQALSRRIVDRGGEPYQKVPEPEALRVKGLAERAAAKDVIERTLKAYGDVKELSPSQRMKSAMAVTGIIDNETRLRTTRPGERPGLTPGAARMEAELATRDAKKHLDGELAVVKQLAAKAQEAATAASDISRPIEARMRSMNDATTYGERMKTAWSNVQRQAGPEILDGLERRLRRCEPYGAAQFAEVKSSLAAPPRVVMDVSQNIEDARERLVRGDRLEEERRQREQQNNVYSLSPRPGQ